METNPLESFIDVTANGDAEIVPPEGETHARFNQILAWSMGIHPIVHVGQIWEDMDLGNSDEYGPRQAAVVKVEESTVELIIIATSPHAARKNIGDRFEVPILSLAPSPDGKYGWRQKFVLVPVNQMGEARPGTYIPPRAPLPSTVASRAGLIDKSKVTSTIASKPKEAMKWVDKTTKAKVSDDGKSMTSTEKTFSADGKSTRIVETVVKSNGDTVSTTSISKNKVDTQSPEKPSDDEVLFAPVVAKPISPFPTVSKGELDIDFSG